MSQGRLVKLAQLLTPDGTVATVVLVEVAALLTRAEPLDAFRGVAGAHGDTVAECGVIRGCQQGPRCQRTSAGCIATRPRMYSKSTSPT